MTARADSMHRRWDVVILGGGFAGLACARRLEKVWGASASERVLLVSAENYFLFQPFLPEVIGAGIEPRHVMNPIRFYLRHCSVQRAEVTAVDLAQRRVEFDAIEGPVPEPAEAEHLVLALGSSTNLRAVPGMMEHGLFLKTLADALALREHIVKRLEEAAVTSSAEIRRPPSSRPRSADGPRTMWRRPWQAGPSAGSDQILPAPPTPDLS